MTPELFLRAKSIFQEALEREPAARAAFLDEVCGADAELRREVDSLLDLESQSPLRHVIAEGMPTRPASLEAAARPGDLRRIGPYEIVSEIGHGGMGTVYLAVRVDAEYRKRVAIKLIGAGMSSEVAVRRFKTERQILAGLTHPNIASLLDGGTTPDGPYLVMEYIEGEPLNKYCDAHQLPTTERLKIFRAVCGAVQYAHQNLVVHRDIKPGNVLVTPEGVPKLLDFGLAKLLDPLFAPLPEEMTATNLRMMTPAYASPEQVRGERITTASDIYSLGVLLYVLLTGRRPYETTTGSYEELIRAVCDQEPTRPSTAVGRAQTITEEGREIRVTAEMVSRVREGSPEKLRRRLSGDLDAIVLKAIRKEPWRRYTSAEQLSEDIGRHLDGLPVSARRGTAWYRAEKFVRRHAMGLAAGAVILVLLVAGLLETSRQRARAERRFNDVRKLANSYLFEFHDAIAKLPGSTPARQLLVQRALLYLDSLSKDASGDSKLQRELAAAYERLGDIQAGSRAGQVDTNLGDNAGAIESFRKAVAIREALATSSRSLDDRRALTTALDRLALVLAHHGESSAGSALIERGLRIREELVNERPGDMAIKRELGMSHHNNAAAMEAVGDLRAMLQEQTSESQIFEAVAAANPGNREDRRNLALGYRSLGASLVATGDKTKGPALLAKAVAIDEGRVAADPNDADARLDLAFSLNAIGRSRTVQDDLVTARRDHERAAGICRELAEADPTNVRPRNGLVQAYHGIGDAWARAGHARGAITAYEKALAVLEPISRTDPKDLWSHSEMAATYAALGRAEQALASHVRTGDAPPHWTSARAWYVRALAIYRELSPEVKATRKMAESVASEIARCDLELQKRGEKP